MCELQSITYKKIIQNNEEKQYINSLEVYQCICGKEYQSFPALYLHSRNKHSIIVTAEHKKKMIRKKLWSGKKRIIIYEFPEEVLDFLEKEVDKEINNKQQMELRKKTEDQDPICEVFAQYKKEISLHHKNEQIVNIIEQLFNCVKEQKQCFQPPYCHSRPQYPKNSPELIPYCLNYFVLKYLPQRGNAITMQKQSLEEILIGFINWLYERKYCSSVVVQAQRQLED